MGSAAKDAVWDEDLSLNGWLVVSLTILGAVGFIGWYVCMIVHEIRQMCIKPNTSVVTTAGRSASRALHARPPCTNLVVKHRLPQGEQCNLNVRKIASRIDPHSSSCKHGRIQLQL